MARPSMHTVRYEMSRHGPRFIRFGLVGLTGVLVNMTFLYLLVAHFTLNHLAGAAIASEISIITNFLLNDHWTFRDVQRSIPWYSRGIRYNAVNVTGMPLYLGVLMFLTDVLGMHYLVGNLFAIGAATLWNYSLNSRFTWASTVPESEHPLPAHDRYVSTRDASLTAGRG